MSSQHSSRRTRSSTRKEKEQASKSAGNSSQIDNDDQDIDLLNHDGTGQAGRDQVKKLIADLPPEDRTNLDVFLAVEDNILKEMKKLQRSWEELNRMTASRLAKWATSNIRSAVPLMAAKTRKADKVDIVLAELKKARAQFRFEHRQLIGNYVKLGLNEYVLINARVALDKYDDEEIDPAWQPESGSEAELDDVDKEDTPGANDNDNDNAPSRIGTLGGGKNRGKSQIENKNDDDNKDGDGSDPVALPESIKKGLDEYLAQAVAKLLASNKLYNDKPPAPLNKKGKDKRTPVHLPGGDELKDGTQDRVPPVPEQTLTKDQQAARKKIAALLGKKPPRSREVCLDNIPTLIGYIYIHITI